MPNCDLASKSEWQQEGGTLIPLPSKPNNNNFIIISGQFDEHVHEWYVEDCIKTGRLLDPLPYKHFHKGPFRGLRLSFQTCTAGMDALIEACRANGAVIVDDDPDLTVCSFSGGQVDAAVSPFYIEEVLRGGRLIGPNHPLHFPCPIDPIPNAHSYILTSTGFDKIERKRVEAMARLMGTFYTSFLSTANTVLIVASDSLITEKTEKARQWNIPKRSYEWLLHGFQTWKLAPL